MITITDRPVWLYQGNEILDTDEALSPVFKDKKVPTASEGRKNTIAYSILQRHNTSGGEDRLKIKFDSLMSHDLTSVSIIQSARASGLDRFPLPYVMTSCHNSLCAVGGTINRDDHMFALSAAEKYGGIFVPANQAVCHQYAREMMSGCGRMILASDSHTRYGALGTMGIGEGGGELVKQLLGKTYDLAPPKVIAVYLDGKPARGIGPHDVALALVGAVFQSGFVKNKVLEFVGPGISQLSVDFRNGVDVMTTESTCLSSIWRTDEKVKEFFGIHGRPEAYAELSPGEFALYDGMVHIDLGRLESMIALPFHPSNVYSIRELNENLEDILDDVEKRAQKQIENPELRLDLKGKIIGGRLRVDQAEIAGCAGGTFENLIHASRILNGKSVPNEYYSLSVYPASNPVLLELLKSGAIQTLISAGAVIKPAFCGPCFGAGDVPSNGALSIRHTTRNFPNREGSKPKEGQLASVALMDARSVAATSANGGFLTPATDVDYDSDTPAYHFDPVSYQKTVYYGTGKPKPQEGLRFGPNIADWPPMLKLQEHILLKISSVITDPVTTTDELIPSGDASSYRSNPMKMASFTLSRRDPQYVASANALQSLEAQRLKAVGENAPVPAELGALCKRVMDADGRFDSVGQFLKSTGFGSAVCAVKPGDGSAREQAASCQRVLGGLANLSVEYATKRYRSNMINWGIIPFIVPIGLFDKVEREDFLFVYGIRKAIADGETEVSALLLHGGGAERITLAIDNLSEEEAKLLLSGSLINYYSGK